MVDKPKLDQMLSNLRRYLGVLRGLAATPREAFLGNADKIGNAKYHLVIAVEWCIDIANHVIASESYRFQRDNADSFAVLVAEGILPGESREPLEAMARFRNRLVHLYWDVDDLRIHDYLQEGLSDIESLANASPAPSGSDIPPRACRGARHPLPRRRPSTAVCASVSGISSPSGATLSPEILGELDASVTDSSLEGRTRLLAQRGAERVGRADPRTGDPDTDASRAGSLFRTTREDFVSTTKSRSLPSRC